MPYRRPLLLSQAKLKLYWFGRSLEGPPSGPIASSETMPQSCRWWKLWGESEQQKDSPLFGLLLVCYQQSLKRGKFFKRKEASPSELVGRWGPRPAISHPARVQKRKRKKNRGFRKTISSFSLIFFVQPILIPPFTIQIALFTFSNPSINVCFNSSI